MASPRKILVIAVSKDEVREFRNCLSCDLEVEQVTLDEAATLLKHDPSVGVVIFDIEGDAAWTSELQDLLSVRPTSRVILVCRLADDCLWMDALEAGAHDLLLKPFDKMEVSSVVRSAMLHSASAAA